MFKANRLLAVLLFVAALYPVSGFSAQCLLSENFDGKTLDDRLAVYGKNWEALNPPQYNLNAKGRDGEGYAFSSGTTSEAHLCWMGDTLSPWPTDELYVSFWMRYPAFTRSDSMENLKVFYPHWDNAKSYVHFTLSDSDTIYYSAMARGSVMTAGNWLKCPKQTDGAWHHYEFYINFTEGVSRFWYDGSLKVDDAFGTGVWSSSVYSIIAPSIDGEEAGKFSRQVDDLDIWDGMPEQGAVARQTAVKPSSPSGLRLTLAR